MLCPVGQPGTAHENAARNKAVRTRLRNMSDLELVLTAEHLTKKVSSPEGELTILDDVSLAIAAGEATAVVGPSGAGKSTLLALLAGLDTPSSGRVFLNGHELTALDEDGRAQVRNREVGFIF